MKTFEDFKDQVLTHIISTFEQSQELMPTYFSGQSQMQEDDRKVFINEIPRAAVKGFGMEASMALIKEMAAIERPNFACLAVQAQLARVELTTPADLANLENLKPKFQEALVLSLQNRLNRNEDSLLILNVYKHNSGRLGLDAPTELDRKQMQMMGEAASALQLIH